MLIITIRTDKPEAELGLYEDDKQLKYESWLAHRQLAETIHRKIDELLKSQQKELKDLGGIVAFQGPGSFTGLRIGLTVANALSYSLGIPIVAREDPNWLENGLAALQNGQNDQLAMPEYGAAPHITQQKK
ncbi:MAG TPA: tRNA (adenosine(37)-N6)-threonylcarbamoyltransferase complex dimerization subunit type 1 TsaB [Candidatus Saccharimonadales bacterium]|nr:tRNA (adenosine(37)-N6)-threonylcarbamoyltransferase complex dimerization subunit type 1 TsaB [Candidatus Saccharimonadales bacterium]